MRSSVIVPQKCFCPVIRELRVIHASPGRARECIPGHRSYSRDSVDLGSNSPAQMFASHARPTHGIQEGVLLLKMSALRARGIVSAGLGNHDVAVTYLDAFGTYRVRVRIPRASRSTSVAMLKRDPLSGSGPDGNFGICGSMEEAETRSGSTATTVTSRNIIRASQIRAISWTEAPTSHISSLD
jgi:hypothetical protein